MTYTQIVKEQMDKLEDRLRSKAPDFPYPWQFVQRLKVKQEIEEEKSFLSSAMQSAYEAGPDCGGKVIKVSDGWNAKK